MKQTKPQAITFHWSKNLFWRDRKLAVKVQDNFQIGILLVCKKKES